MGRTRSAATVRRTTMPHAPRRVSGPIRPGHPRPVTAVPPRIHVPAHPGARRAASAGVAGRLRAVPDHPWLDGLLRSRAWIWILGVALGGIVAMQVSLLEMNSGIGRAVQTTSTLQHANAELEEEVAELSSGSRLRAAAAGLGLVAPDAGEVGYLTVRPELDALRAAQNMTAPSAEAEQVLAGTAPLASEPAATTAPVTTTAPPATTAPVTTTAPETTAPTTTTTAPAPAATPAPVAAAPTETPPVTPPVNQTAGAVAAPAG